MIIEEFEITFKEGSYFVAPLSSFSIILPAILMIVLYLLSIDHFKKMSAIGLYTNGSKNSSRQFYIALSIHFFLTCVNIEGQVSNSAKIFSLSLLSLFIVKSFKSLYINFNSY
jgi:hypothetical protein